MVHRVYMCSNLKCPLVVQEFDQVEGCNNNNLILSTSSSFVLKKQVNFQEGERYWLLPTICPPTKIKPRTVCSQEGEDNEDMTSSDMTIVYKVSSFLHVHGNFWYTSLDFHMYMSLFDYRYKCISKCKSIEIEHLVRRQPDSTSLGRG